MENRIGVGDEGEQKQRGLVLIDLAAFILLKAIQPLRDFVIVVLFIVLS